MTPRITVVGLGPGDPALVTVATLETLRSSRNTHLRSGRHPSAHLAVGATTFDHVYESEDSFDRVYERIAGELVRSAQEHGEVVYAVPGSPLVLEQTVATLRKRDDIDLVVHPALSFLDDAWRALGIDPVESRVRLIDGHEFAAAAAGETGPMLVAHTHANWVLSDIKLCVENPVDDSPVVLLHHVGLPDERIVHTTWSHMDRTVDADHLTSLFIPGLATPVAAEMVRFHELARTLRAKCPWDIEQTHRSLVRYLLEETYEVVDAIEALDPALTRPGRFDRAVAVQLPDVAGRRQILGVHARKVKMGPGTLYGSIARMTEAGLVRECDKRVDPQIDDERRIYYELTSEGQAALEAELSRYRDVVAVAKRRWAHGH